MYEYDYSYIFFDVVIIVISIIIFIDIIVIAISDIFIIIDIIYIIFIDNIIVVIFGIVGLHVAAVHVHGSNNPAGIDIRSKNDTVNFFPYMLIKDTIAVCVFGVLISAVIFFGPNLMAEVDNYIPADPLVTPAHIVPNWYLAPFYAILRAVPDKLGGVALMFGAIAILFVLPWLDTSKVRSCNFRPMYKWFMMLFFVNFFVLGYVGMLPAEGLYLLIARVCHSLTGKIHRFKRILI